MFSIKYLTVWSLASLALLAACNGTVDSDSESGGAGGTGTGGDSGISDAAGATGCPTQVPSAYSNIGSPCKDQIGQVCSYKINCQSGTVDFELECQASGVWVVLPKACDKPYDSCPGTDLHCQGAGSNWAIPVSGDPPAACPGTKPNAGDVCMLSPFGGAVTPCGYPCDTLTKSGWTLLSCSLTDAGNNVWASDNACP